MNTDKIDRDDRSGIMIDVETMSTAPNAALVAVGAVRFGLRGVGETFYRRVDLSSAMAAGLIADGETIRWWMRKSEEARDEVARLPGGDLGEVLHELEQWIIQTDGPAEPLIARDKPLIWGNGAVSDPVWLASAYEACGFEVPWRHWQVRCFRTLKAMLPWVTGPERTGTAHHALHDAVTQAKHAVLLLRQLRDLGGLWAPPAAGHAEPHEVPCPLCGDTGTAAEPDGAGGWRPVACGCWAGLKISSGGPSIMAAPLAAGAHLSVSDNNLSVVDNSPAATEANESAETAAGFNGGSAAPCAAAPGESILTAGVSSLPREYWQADHPGHGG